MIVADCNLIAYLLIPGDFTAAAEQALQRDDQWVAPPVWRAEFINVLATCVRSGLFDIDAALRKLAAADAWIAPVPESFDERELIQLSVQSRVAIYDCIYVLLARKLGCTLVTNDKEVLRKFPDVAIGIQAFASRN
jgi:predicted nucleic acid-binding protein